MTTIEAVLYAEYGDQEGVKSVLRNCELFSAFHIVLKNKHNGNETHLQYPTWEQDLEQLKTHGLKPRWHLNELDLKQVTSRAIVEFQSGQEVHKSDLDILLQDIETKHETCDFYAVGTDEVANRLEEPFVCIVRMVDYIRVATHLGQHYLRTDLKAQLLNTRYPNNTALPAPYRFYQWPFWTTRSTRRTGSIKLHKWARWLPHFSVAWCFWFLMSYALLVVPLQLYTTRSFVTSYFSQTPMILSFFMTISVLAWSIYLGTLKFIHPNIWWPHFILFPIYFTISPIVFLIKLFV